MYYRVGYCVVLDDLNEFPKQDGDKLDVTEVRRISSNIPNLKELGINEASKVISFQVVDSGWKINVYYTTGTVGTCVEHPISGKTQMFRRKVNYETLQQIFQNPRVHTGKGYYTAPKSEGKPTTFESSFVAEDEETALLNQIAVLKPQLELMEEQLASIRQTRAKEEQERLKKAEAIRKAKEEKVRAAAAAAAAAEQLRRENIARQVAKERLAASNRANSLRGACFDYCLSYSEYFPTSMKDVKCVAISNGGYIAVDDNGSCSWHSIPTEVVDIIERQHNSMIDYVALGPEQYYIRKTNGKIFYGGCHDFVEAIDTSRKSVDFVTFGSEDTFFIQFEDGSMDYSENLLDKLPYDAFDNLTSCAVRHFYVGQGEDYYGRVPYCITYENGRCEYDNLPKDLAKWFRNEKKPGNKMKQVLADTTGCYFVRYT